MTFTIMGRCTRTGQVGVASATVSLGVGGLAFWFTSRGDVIASQAYASKRNGQRMYLAMEAGKSAEEAIAIPKAEDDHVAFRQLMILPQGGTPLAYTGGQCRPWAGHIVEPHLIVAGNVLSGERVVEAMAAAFRGSDGADLDERLVLALEAGRDAGGQAMPDGTGLAERSASIRVVEGGKDAGLAVRDLRVDMHNSAVHELRQLFEVYKVYGPYSDLREVDPEHTPAMALFEADLVKKGGRFAARPSCYR
jgi:uncharacterized Ntn-hydrolase superfamily protein